MRKRRCLRCEEVEMALLGNATIPVTSGRDPSGLDTSKMRSETVEFLFRIHICPKCGYVEFSK